MAPDDRIQFARVMMTRLMTRNTHPLSTIIKVRWVKDGREAPHTHTRMSTDGKNAHTTLPQIFNRNGDIKLVRSSSQ